MDNAQGIGRDYTAELGTAWTVITGPPSSGKTTLIDALAATGHRVVAETARAHIAESGCTPDQVAADRDLQIRLQHGIAERQRRTEQTLEPAAPLFLDRALPDSIAYFELLGVSAEQLLANPARRYLRVYYLEGLPLRPDGLRYEDDQRARAIGEGILRAYRRLGYAPIRVPTFAQAGVTAAIAQRLSFVLGRSST